jgi:hypothetical protein
MGTMRFSINLRSDLTKLSDADLAAELDRLSDYRRVRFGETPKLGGLRQRYRYASILGWPFGRGPVRHRIAYKIQIGYFGFLRGPLGTKYLTDCEIMDLRDEIQRRAKLKRTGPWGIGNEQNSELR